MQAHRLGAAPNTGAEAMRTPRPLVKEILGRIPGKTGLISQPKWHWMRIQVPRVSEGWLAPPF
jgi:hypothetical protein